MSERTYSRGAVMAAAHIADIGIVELIRRIDKSALPAIASAIYEHTMARVETLQDAMNDMEEGSNE